MFKKVLIANRGEIAMRVIRACRMLGVRTVAIHSTADSEALHVRFADEAVCVGPPEPAKSYLHVPAIIAAAEVTNADAIHPGYGFLSENAAFAELCKKCRLTWIGPSPDAMRQWGDKVTAAEREALRPPAPPRVRGHHERGARHRRGAAHRLPRDPEGLRRRWRARHAHRPHRGRDRLELGAGRP
jgi:acetyl/propionyl-CoA carboxylase alpha subunit